MTTLIVLALTTTVVAFVLSAGETALQRMSRHRAEQLLDEGRSGARALVRITREVTPYLAVATFVRVTAEAATAVMVAVAVDMVTDNHTQTALIASAIMAVVLFVVVGVSPRTLGRQHVDVVALLSAPLVRLLRLFLGPLAKLLVLIGNAVTPGRGFSEGPFATESELRELVDLAGESAVIEDDEREMIHSIFELGDTVAREVMVPRPDLVTIKGEKVLRQAMSLFLRSGFSRVPVIGEDTDDVLGMLYFKDVVRAVNSRPEAAATTPVTEVMRQVQRVPEMKRVDELLREMQQARAHVALVIDEYGGTAGLITIEDVVEEIVGEITDEYDRDQAEVEPIVAEDGQELVRVPANMLVDDLAEMFDVEIETEDVDSVGGLLATAIGMVPIQGSVGEVAGLELTAERMAGRRRRVATVLVRRLRQPEPGEEDAVPDRDEAISAQNEVSSSAPH
ncbi:hemolysin family protein [Ornithinimicrobium pratense]|uniref:HlyC/CorC family transporter n=1 Tax=Ornithinimicrobium pratense TaxID=2593973 RepID=A0A5J6V5K9_9MICO|nr:hemolysin family protein [Ornithinimicrobium pratense]QFG68887.1 HlyC/CorC family transporter [Ornithinimicrobium pratense]